MRPYGLPRSIDVENPDVADIQKYGMQSSAGRLPTASGDHKSYTRDADARQQTRRQFKRMARRDGKAEAQRGVDE